MFKRIVKVVVLSFFMAIVISALWYTGYSDHLSEFQYMSWWEWNFDPARGGTERFAYLQSSEGGIKFMQCSDVLLSEKHLANWLAGAPPQSVSWFSAYVPYIPTYKSLAGRREWLWGGGLPTPFAASLPQIGPNWTYGGFDFGRWTSFWPPGSGVGVVVPDWFILAVALIAPAIYIRRLWFLLVTQSVLSGHCRSCGLMWTAVPDRCPECGAEPSWRAFQVSRMKGWHWFVWYRPALVLWGCSCVELIFDLKVTATIFVGIASVSMIVFLVMRAALAGKFAPLTPRGFAVVMKPPPGGDEAKPKSGA